MKKFTVLLLSVLLACPLFANEAAVRELLQRYNDYTKTMQFEKLLEFTATDYTGITAKGERLTYKKVVALCKLFALCNDPESKFSEYIASAAAMSGTDIPADTLAQYQAFDGTPKGKEAAQKMRTELKAKMAEMKESFKQVADSFKIVSVKVDGNDAVAVYTEYDPVDKRNKKTQATFAKRNGKWLLVKEVTTYF